jgi:toxin ParE1/3/4
VLEIAIAPAAKADIAQILVWSDDHFGSAARKRYQALIGAAIYDLAQNPYRLGSVDRPEIAAGCRTYHLSHSRRRAARQGFKVKAPRHFIVYRIGAGATLHVARILHDSIDVDPQPMPAE